MPRNILFLLWLALALATPASAQTTPTGKFLHLSDIHFDPFADPSLVGQLTNASVDQWEAILQTSSSQTPTTGKKDSNYALLKSALMQAQNAQSAGNYDYIVYTGDYLSHGFIDQMSLFIRDPAKQKAFPAQTVAFVNWMIAKYFPGKPLIATLGNNDSNCNDYRLTPGGDIMSGVEATLPVVANDPAALADFAAGGYYRTPHPTLANVDFLVLSIFWSDGWWNECGSGPADPRAAQMQWLGKKLADAQQNGRRAIILMHIPPGMDAFSSYKAKGPGKTMWTSDGKMLSQFWALASQYKAQLIDGFAGHTHMDEFRIIADTAPIMAIRMAPSVTPSNGNRPAFTVMDYDTTDGSVTDYTVSSYDQINGWTAYDSFTALYGFKRYSAANLQTLAGSVLTDPGTALTYSKMYATGNRTPATGNIVYFGCALTELSSVTYAPCVKPKSRKKARN
jgi:hypothetical protein